MLFYIHYKGKEHRVRVENRRQGQFVSFDDGPEEKVDINFYGHDCTFIRDNHVFFSNVSGTQTDYKVWNPAGTLLFGVESEYKRLVSKLKSQDIEIENRIVAKMPGKILKVHVKEGDAVAKGQPVMVMEAMKMENEIVSGCEGTISRIHAKEGQAVEAGALLIECDMD